jgi:multimeric flavodoxin WrbA
MIYYALKNHILKGVCKMFLIITSSPNVDGLTAACGKAAFDGITGAGGKAEIIDISAAKLEPCRICGDGWGTCRDSSKCVIDDILPVLQAKIRDAEGIFLVTPVYWGQPSERMKYFLDRFRRCEAFGRSDGAASGKQVDLVAAAGGSGNGTATCLAEMERWCQHVSAIPQERICITRFNRATVLPVIADAAARLVTGDYFKRF